MKDKRIKKEVTIYPDHDPVNADWIKAVKQQREAREKVSKANPKDSGKTVYKP